MEFVNALTSSDIVTLVVLALVLLAGLVALRFALRLTATLMRIGCFLIFLIVIGAAIFFFVTP